MTKAILPGWPTNVKSLFSAKYNVCCPGAKEFKVDPVRVLRQDIRLWSADPQRWEARLAVLREMDLSIAKLITTCPAVLTHTPETLRAKVETLDRMGLCATKIVNHFPSALGLSGDRVRNRIFFVVEGTPRR